MNRNRILDDEHALPDWLEPMDHTADEGFRVRAETPARLFERAAWGMFSCITDLRGVRSMQSFHLSLEAPDREALLVRWLSELNRRHQTEGLLFGAFEVLEMEERRLRARVEGEPLDPRRHERRTEIKGVTYHGLSVGRDASGWHATIVFDI